MPKSVVRGIWRTAAVVREFGLRISFERVTSGWSQIENCIAEAGLKYGSDFLRIGGWVGRDTRCEGRGRDLSPIAIRGMAAAPGADPDRVSCCTHVERGQAASLGVYVLPRT